MLVPSTEANLLIYSQEGGPIFYREIGFALCEKEAAHGFGWAGYTPLPRSEPWRIYA